MLCFKTIGVINKLCPNSYSHNIREKVSSIQGQKYQCASCIKQLVENRSILEESQEYIRRSLLVEGV